MIQFSMLTEVLPNLRSRSGEVQGTFTPPSWLPLIWCRFAGGSPRAAALEVERRICVHALKKQFWCEDLSTYALALDGPEAALPCPHIDAGHCLYTGIRPQSAAASLPKPLSSRSHSAAGAWRTVRPAGRVNNPLSYHNGSIWPHDNSLIASGSQNTDTRSGPDIYGLLDLAAWSTCTGSRTFLRHRPPRRRKSHSFIPWLARRSLGGSRPFLILQAVSVFSIMPSASESSSMTPIFQREFRPLPSKILIVAA